MERKKKRPTHIELDTGKGQLVIAWKDGRESRFSLVDLRKNCPCAVCRDLRGASGAAPEPSAPGELKLVADAAATATAAAQRFDYVGRYGIRITWADGHDTGICTFEALREQDETTQ